MKIKDQKRLNEYFLDNIYFSGDFCDLNCRFLNENQEENEFFCDLFGDNIFSTKRITLRCQECLKMFEE